MLALTYFPTRCEQVSHCVHDKLPFWYLKLDIARTDEGIKLSMGDYANKLEEIAARKDCLKDDNTTNAEKDQMREMIGK